MYTVEQISTRYRVKETTVLGWIHSGELRAVNVGRAPGKQKPRWRISVEALAAFEAARTPTPTPAPGTRRAKRATAGVVAFYT